MGGINVAQSASDRMTKIGRQRMALVGSYGGVYTAPLESKYRKHDAVAMAESENLKE